MNTNQHGSTVSAIASKARGRTARCLMGAAALGTVFATIAGPGIAGEKVKWELETDSAYFVVYSYHCAPAFLESAAKERPHGMEVAILDFRFRADYNGDCRAYYLKEIAPRIGEYGAFVVTR